MLALSGQSARAEGFEKDSDIWKLSVTPRRPWGNAVWDGVCGTLKAPCSHSLQTNELFKCHGVCFGREKKHENTNSSGCVLCKFAAVIAVCFNLIWAEGAAVFQGVSSLIYHTYLIHLSSAGYCPGIHQRRKRGSRFCSSMDLCRTRTWQLGLVEWNNPFRGAGSIPCHLDRCCMLSRFSPSFLLSRVSRHTSAAQVLTYRDVKLMCHSKCCWWL